MGGPTPKVEYICQSCKAHFFSRKRYDRVVRFCSKTCYGLTKKGKPSWNVGKPMRPETKEKLRKAFFRRGSTPWNKGRPGPSGPDSPTWRGGRYIGTDGYVYVYQPEHHRAGGRGYVKEHILVAEKCLNRRLVDAEVVHHIDENKSHNDPFNLYVFENNGRHLSHHLLMKSGKEQPKVSNLSN